MSYYNYRAFSSKYNQKSMFSSLLVIASAIAAVIAAPTSPVPGVVSVPFGKGLDPNPVNSEHYPLLTTLEFGSQKAPIEVAVDSGSYVLWVPLPTAETKLTHYGAFDPKDSSSAVFLKDGASIVYGKRSDDHILYYNDTVVLPNGLTIPSVSFGVANASNVNFPVWGIAKGQQNFGPSFIADLKADGHIKTQALSFYEGNDYEGEILYGGIDHAKYKGELYTNTLSGVGYLGFSAPKYRIFNETFDFGNTVLVDSGWNVAFAFPVKKMNHVLDTWKNASSPDLCKGPTDLSFEYYAENGLLEIFLHELVRKRNDGSCYLDVESCDDSSLIIGTKGLQHVYISANFEENTFSFARKVDTTESNIVAL